MATPPTPPDQPDEPETGPTEPIASGGPRRLTRSSSDKVLGGVAGGLGRYFDIDPIIFRIGFVVLTLAGGAGLLAYAAAWLFVPADPVPGVTPPPRNRALTIVGAALLVIAACVMFGTTGLFFAGPPLVGLALIALLGAALWRVAEGRGGDGNQTLRRAGLGILLLVVAGVGFVAVAIGAAAGGGAVFAGLVIAIGAALTVSAFVGGGARWLVLPALVIAIPLGFVAAAGIDIKGGVGDRDYRPTTLAEVKHGYKLGAGQLRIDLRNVDLPAGRTPLKLHMGVGSVRVLVPQDVCVASKVRVGAGYARVLDRDSAGIDVDWRNSPIEGAGTKRLVIAGNVGIGELQVANDVSEFDDHVRRGQVGRDFGDPALGNSIQDNGACQAAA